MQPPNLLSLARLASGPVVAYYILQHDWRVAVPLLVASGITDWLDGYAARKLGQQSVVGSYLDPFADKVLICCVIGALGYQGLVPGWVAGLVVGRDVVLVGATLAYRLKMVGGTWPGATEFFRTVDPKQSAPPAADGRSEGMPVAPSPDAAAGNEGKAAGSDGGLQQDSSSQAQAEGPAGGGAAPGMPVMQPLMISKVNTVLQLALVSACMTHHWFTLPAADAVAAVEYLTAATTLASFAAYGYKFSAGTLLIAGQQPKTAA